MVTATTLFITVGLCKSSLHLLHIMASGAQKNKLQVERSSSVAKRVLSTLLAAVDKIAALTPFFSDIEFDRSLMTPMETQQ